MGAFAADDDAELVAGGKAGAWLDGELTDLHAGPVVHAEDGLHRELLEQAVADHLARAAAAFFGRLEDEVHGAIEVAVPGQVPGGGEQHRSVAVVAACVHLARVAARVREAVVLGDRQRVDVRAQADGPVGRAVPDDAHDAGLAEAPLDGYAPVGQGLGDDVGGADLFEAEFGVGVDVAPQGGNAGAVGQDGFDELHRLTPEAAGRR